MELDTQPRQPSGTPVGGQFAGKSNPESDIELEDGPTGLFELPDGTQVHLVDGLLSDPHTPHDRPAVFNVNGRREWWDHGVRHRDYGPAVELPRLPGTSSQPKLWFDHGVVTETRNGYYIASYEGGVRHNPPGGFAIEGDDFFESWVNGRRHSLDGPAVSGPDGNVQWWVRGRWLANPLRRGWSPPVTSVRAPGITEFRIDTGASPWNRSLHRTDGPARVSSDGTETWYFLDLVHRDDGGPATIGSDGTQKWREFGRWHRLDGPAVIRPDGTTEWWIDDIRLPSLDLSGIGSGGSRSGH